jgi:hypothetical protein
MTEETNNMTTFVVDSSKKFEIDLSEEAVNGLMEDTDADSPESALAELMGQQVTNSVEPSQKLLEVNVTVDGPSDD